MGITIDDLGMISASGTVGVVPTDEIELPDPIIPNVEGKVFLLFEWGDYDGRGGINDLAWSGSLENCMAQRSKDNAQIAIQTLGEPKVVLEWLNSAWMGNGYRVTGWSPVIKK